MSERLRGLREQKADACENCLDDRSCTAGAFMCATECIGIVP